MKGIAKDKRVLFLLGFLVFSALFYNFYYSREINDIKKIREEVKWNQVIVDSGLAIDSDIQGIDSELKILNEKLNKIRVMFPPRFNHDEILINVRDAAQNAGLQIETIKYSDTEKIPEAGNAVQQKTESNQKTSNTRASAESEAKIEEDTVAGVKKTSDAITPTVITDKKLSAAMDKMGLNIDSVKNTDKAKATEKNQFTDGKGFSLTLDISAKGTNSQIKGFLKNIMNLEKRVVFYNTQINKSNDDILVAGFQLKFLGIYDSKAPYNDSEFEPSTEVSKDSIFNSYEGYVEPLNAIANGDNTKKGNIEDSNPDAAFYDFAMRAMPFREGMSTPTLSIVGRNLVSDTAGSKIPVIYGDKREVERVELYVEENNGKLLCKFKTEHEAFPDKEYKLLEEFRPVGGEIRLLIDSTGRISQKDISGVDISLINKTSRKLTVEVVNDDTGRPRIRIGQKDGTIEVKYK